MTTGLLDRLRETRLSAVRRIAILALGMMFAAFQICGLLGIRVNTSPSLPIGFYRASPDPNANLIEFCPAEPFGSLAASPGYRDQGICRNGGAPLLKPIVAKPGDIVELSDRGIEVNGDFCPTPLRSQQAQKIVLWPHRNLAGTQCSQALCGSLLHTTAAVSIVATSGRCPQAQYALEAAHSNVLPAITPAHCAFSSRGAKFLWRFGIVIGRSRRLVHSRDPLGDSLAARLDGETSPISLACPACALRNRGSAAWTDWMGISVHRNRLHFPGTAWIGLLIFAVFCGWMSSALAPRTLVAALAFVAAFNDELHLNRISIDGVYADSHRVHSGEQRVMQAGQPGQHSGSPSRCIRPPRSRCGSVAAMTQGSDGAIRVRAFQSLGNPRAGILAPRLRCDEFDTQWHWHYPDMRVPLPFACVGVGSMFIDLG